MNSNVSFSFSLVSARTGLMLARGLFLSAVLLLTACGGGGVSTSDGGEDLESPLPVGIDGENLQPGTPGQQPASPDQLALLPAVAVNGRQMADPNVLIRLEGSVEAAAGARIVQTLWVQVVGPAVVISEPQSLVQLVQVPNVTSPVLMRFRLTALDSEGRINSAAVSVVVQPVIDEPAAPTEKLVQSIQFAAPGPFEVIAGETFANNLSTTAAAPGIGAVTYTSSNIQVASVDANGLVSTFSVGSVEITATKAEDSVYLGASNSYTLVVVEPPLAPVPTALDFDALIGAAGALVTFKYPVNGYEFLRSSSTDCTPFNECSEITSQVLPGTSIVDSLTLATTGYFWLSADGVTSQATEVPGFTRGFRVDEPPARSSHGFVALNDRLWILGGVVQGFSEEDQSYYDVWSSADGISWTLLNEQLVEPQDFNEFSAGTREVVIYGNALWVTAEGDGEGLINLYHSTDGETWTRETRGFEYDHKLVVFGDRLLAYESAFLPDGGNSTVVWEYSSQTGWSAEPQAVPFTSLFTSLYSKRSIEFNGSLWMFSGERSEQASIWSSTDGVNWTGHQTETGELFATYDYQVVEFDGALWVFNADGNIYRSSDALEWTLIDSDLPPSPSAKVTVFNNQLWLHGGLDFANNEGEPTLGDTWVSDDGQTWRKVYRGRILFEEEPDLAF